MLNKPEEFISKMNELVNLCIVSKTQMEEGFRSLKIVTFHKWLFVFAWWLILEKQNSSAF